MANTLITPSQIAKEALFHLENNMVAGHLVHRDYKKEFVEIGNSVTIRKPVQFVAKDGATRVNQDVLERSTSITIDKRKHVSWPFTMEDLTLTVGEYSERYIKGAMIALANAVNVDVLETAAQGFFARTGTPGTTPSAFIDLANCARKLDNNACPDDGQRNVVLNPDAKWTMADGMGGTGSGGIFNADIVSKMVRNGQLGTIARMGIYGDQNVYAHTTGNHNGTPLVNDAAFTNGSNTVDYDGMSGTGLAVFLVGDTFTIDGVYQVNAISKKATQHLQQFVVTAISQITSGAGTVSVYPALDDGTTAGTAAYQTVSALPADNAPINIVGAANAIYPQNLAFHRNAVALVTVPINLPQSAGFASQANWRGYSIRVVQDYDIDADEEIVRLDIMYGSKVIYPELGVRLDG